MSNIDQITIKTLSMIAMIIINVTHQQRIPFAEIYCAIGAIHGLW